MSLTYSLSQPNQALPRATTITLIVLMHISAVIVFNRGIGSFFISSPPHDMTVVPVKSDPQPVTPLPLPEPSRAMPDHTLSPPMIDPGTIVFTVAPEKDSTDIPPADSGKTEINATDTAVPPATKISVLNRVDPAYPAHAEAAGEQGTVFLDVQIDARGNVIDVNIAQSSGFGELDAAAAKAVKYWHFTLVTSGARVRVPIRFQLNSQKY